MFKTRVSARTTEVEEFKSRVSTLEEQLASVVSEKANLAQNVEKIQLELSETRTQKSELAADASKLASVQEEFDQQRKILEDVQAELRRVKEEKETLAAEKTRQDNVMRDLQAQLAGVSKAVAHKRDGSGDSAPQSLSSRVVMGERVMSLSRPNGLPPAKLPPLTPPPSIPPPPLPTMSHMSHDASVSSHTTNARDSSSSRNSTTRTDSPIEPSTPSTSVVISPVPTTGNFTDSRLAGLVEEQAKTIEEQETMIKTLNKQLTHCESDLQAHMDLVATLETSLTDSERNRKFLHAI